MRPYQDPPQKCPACGLDGRDLDATPAPTSWVGQVRPSSGSPFRPRFQAATLPGEEPTVRWTCRHCGYGYVCGPWDELPDPDQEVGR